MIVQFARQSAKDQFHSFDRIGYLTSCGYLYFCEGRKVHRCKMSDLSEKMKITHELPSNFDRKKVDSFFLHNYPTSRLFKFGIEKVLIGDVEFFSKPIKLPCHDELDSITHASRCNELELTAKAGDVLCTFNPKSPTSQFIAKFDRGVWSHVATVTENKTVIEAVTAGVREISLSYYLREPFRLGLYRHPNVPQDLADRMFWMRSKIGDGYSYRKAAIAGILTRVGLQSKAPTPNAICLGVGIELLVHV